MKVASVKSRSGINLVCTGCGVEALKNKYNKKLKQSTVSTYHMNICDVCGRHKFVTEVRDFGYPIFILTKKKESKIEAIRTTKK